MSKTVKCLSEKYLKELSGPKLAEHYNVLAEKLNMPGLKKFRDKNTGVKRCLDIQKVWQAKSSKKQKRRTIKQASIEYILADKDDMFIVKAIQEEFPTSAFDQGHISWLRCTLFRDGMIEAKHAPRRSKAYKNWLLTQTK